MDAVASHLPRRQHRQQLDGVLYLPAIFSIVFGSSVVP
jgi:hypothetical protein